jgi:hypothetical protein
MDLKEHNREYDMKLKNYMENRNINESKNLEIYSSLLNSVDTAVNIINLIMTSGDENVKDLAKLQSAKDKLDSAYSDLKKLPIELMKNMVISGWNSIKNKIFTWIT